MSDEHEKDRACSRENLAGFVRACQAVKKPIDQAVAEMIALKFAGAALSGAGPEMLIATIRHMLADYREILITEIEARYGKPDPRPPLEEGLKFRECAVCSLRPGAPGLCPGCVHNRLVIEELRRRLQDGGR